jgi:hypothetical protein
LRVARYLPGRRSGFRQHALADQHFVRNPECIAWVTGQSEISVVEETGVSRTSTRFYAGSGTIPIQNMVLSPTSEIARRLLDHKISAVPVFDGSGMAIGMVSEGDLIGRNDSDREERRDWGGCRSLPRVMRCIPIFWRPCGIPNSAPAMSCPPQW